MTKQAIDVDELRSFPFEVPRNRDGTPTSQTTRIEVVEAYESGVRGLVIHRSELTEGGWTVRHGPTGVGLIEAATFDIATDVAKDFGETVGADRICSAETLAAIGALFGDWNKNFSEEAPFS